MFRQAFLAAVAATSLMGFEGASAQDGGIWVARPHPKRSAEESVPASALPGIAPGLTVLNNSGQPIGRISKIVAARDGSIRKVVVISLAGNFFNLSPSALSISGQVVTTTQQ